MAEISVPAWPIPTHQTKLMMAKPQPTGLLTPQMPMPGEKRLVTAQKNTISRLKDTANATNQNKGVRRVSTMELILSVTEANVSPGAITGASGFSKLMPGLARSPGWDCAERQGKWSAGACSTR